MSLFKFFKTDAKAEAEGNLFTLMGPDGLPLFRVRLRRAGGANQLVDIVRERVFAPYRRVLSDLEPKTKDSLTHKVYAEAVTVPGTWEMYEREGMTCQGNKFDGKDWLPEVPSGRTADGFVKGISNEKDEIVQDSVANIAAVFDALPDVFAIIVLESNTADSYKPDGYDADTLEHDSKN
jgi:hypothetical protein